MRTTLIALLASTGVAMAQPRVASIAEPIVADPIGVRVHVLDNGLTVMLSVNRAEPRVQTLIAIRAGSKNDPADNTGLAHYLEHMLFKGTDRIGSKDFAAEKPLLENIERLYEDYTHTTDEAKRRATYRAIDSISGLAARYVIANEYDRMLGSLGAKGTNAWTWFDQTVYTNDVPSNQLERWMTIEAERFRKPMLRLFHTELEAVYEEKNRSLDRDDNKQSDVAFARLFTKHPYGTQTTLGTVEHLKNPSLRKIREFYERYYVPNNMAVIISGDIDPDATLAMVQRHFGSMTRRQVPLMQLEPEPSRNAPIEESVYGPDPESVLVAMRLPGGATREGMLLEIVDQLLNYKDAGMIDLELEKKQKVLEAWSAAYTFNDYSAHLLGGRPLEGQSLEQVRDLLLEQIARIKRGDFDEDQLRAIMTNRRIDRTQSFESNEGRAYTMLDAFVEGTGWSEYLMKLDEAEHVTKNDIVGFANRYFTDDYVVVYKRIGEDTSIVKITKPAITPVELDRESTSEFARATLSIPAAEAEPTFVDFASAITTVDIAPRLPLRFHRNVENDLFTLSYVYEMGERNWRELPIAIELLPFLGTRSMTAEQISRELFKLGVSLSVFAGDYEARLTLNGPRSALERAVAIIEDLLSNVQPDQKALDGLVERELKQRADAKLDKSEIFWEGLYSYAEYGAKNPFNDIISEAELRKLEADDMASIIRSLRSVRHDVMYYGPGDADSTAAVLRRLHVVPTVLRDLPAERVYARPDQTEKIIYFVNQDMVQAEILWLRKGSAFDVATAPTAAFFNEYFGGSMGAIVFQEIREARALAYSSFSAYSQPERLADPAHSIAYIGTQADKVGDAIGAMNNLLRAMPRSESAFTSARQALRNQIGNDRTIRQEVLDEFLAMRRLGLSYELRRDTWRRLDAVTLKDVVDFHAAHFGDRPFTMAVIGSKDRIDMSALAKYGRVVEISLEQVFGY